LPLDLRGQAVKTLQAAIGSRQQQVTDGSRYAAITIIKRMKRNKPEMSEPSLD